MNRTPGIWTAAALAAMACGTIVEPAPAGSGRLRIDRVGAERTEQGWMVRAEVTNVSGTDYYANVGDRFNAALEQERLAAARGTHAVIERRVGERWEPANAGILVEGTRFVVLRAGRTYTLEGFVDGGAGAYRVRFDYSPVNEDPSDPLPLRDYSATFVIF